MNTLFRIAALLLAGMALMGAPALAATDLADMPMAVRNNAPPNFMFMIDNSGSMSNIVPDLPYSPDAGTYKCTGKDKKIQPDNSVSLRVVGGKPMIELGSKVGSTSCSSGCTLGTDKDEVCFDDAATYTDVRLLASESCGRNCQTADGANYLSADYTGHYLNWYFGSSPSTGWDDRKPGTETRLEVAKKGAKAALDTIPLKTTATATKARVGAVTYNGSNGGDLMQGLADLDSTQLANVKSEIDALTSSGSTPLSETLADIGQYLTRGYTGKLTAHPGGSDEASVSVATLFTQDSTSPHKLKNAPSGNCSGAACPVQYWCQRSYAILMTDGRPQSDQALSSNSYLCDYDGDSGSCTTSGSRKYDQKTGGAASSHDGHLGGPHSYESAGSDYLDDVAQALFEIDLRPDLVAPSDRKKSNNLRTYTVGFADLQAQNDPLMREAAKQGGGLFLTADNLDSLKGAFVSAINNALQTDGAAAAVAVTSSQITSDSVSYASSYYSGYWTGNLEAFSIDTSSGLPITPPLWSAQAKLDALASPHTSRNIVSYDGSSGKAFTAANFRDDAAGLTAGVIDYLRGARSGEGTTYRVRQSLLGDIVNAEPVVVNDGSKSVVYQGANDGMLHVFDGSSSSTGGKELWAYVPGLVQANLPQLASLNYVHRYYVDATPAVGDVDNSGFSKKILVGGLGKGGRGYYALDISSSTAASEGAAAGKVLWETDSDPEMGYSFGTPLIVKTPGDGWVVLVTSGYDNDGGGHVWALDPKTGSVLRHIATGVGTSGAPAGLAHLGRVNNAPSDRTEQFVYGGDLLGNVWRFDLTNWSAVRIAQLEDGGGAAQPVTSAPAVSEVAGAPGKYFVYVGTGQYLGDSDVPGGAAQNAHATQTQSMYGIIDDTANTSPSLPDIRGANGSACPSDGGNGDFLCQKAVSTAGGTYTMTSYSLRGEDRGWYFDLPIANSRINGHPALTTSGVLVFTANVPTNAICDPGGSSWFFAVSAASGGAILKKAGATETYESGWFLDHTLGSRPVIVQTSTGKRALVRMSDKGVENPLIPETQPATPSAVPWRRIYWRELL